MLTLDAPATEFHAAHTDRPASLLPLRVHNVTLEAGGQRLIDGIDLTLSAGGVTAIMGPNGAGKSLFLRLLHGLIAPSSGRIDWNGTAPSDATRRQALVFQKPVLLRRSAAANVAFALRTRGGDPRRAEAYLAQVGLAGKARQAARRLSGGEQQRLALARALATGPEVLFLDEPTASLDPASTLMIERVVAEIRTRGTRVIWVTHDAAQARRVADEIVFLHRGRVAEHGPAARVLTTPASAEARAFLDGQPVV